MADTHRSNILPQWLSITGQPLNLNDQSSFQGDCVPINSFEKLNQLGEGTYGIVYRAKERESSKVVALKQVRISPEERQNGIPITVLREISILQSLKHDNIINVINVAVEDQLMDEVYMVMEYAEQDLTSILDELNVKFSMSEVKCLFWQLLEGIEYLHRNDIIHRDVKMQNILLTAKGVLKLADFGMARVYSPRPLTPGVVTIWYRAPELLLGTKYYTTSVDLWSGGVVLAELLQSTPCLTGETPIEQLSLIVKLIGSPTPDDHAALSAIGCPDLIKWRMEGLTAGRADNIERKFLAETSHETIDFLRGLLRWDPQARWTAAEALGKGQTSYAETAERWWRANPRAVARDLLPTYPEIRNKSNMKPTADGTRVDLEGTADECGSGYVFDFGDESMVYRPNKRPRAR